MASYCLLVDGFLPLMACACTCMKCLSCCGIGCSQSTVEQTGGCIYKCNQEGEVRCRVCVCVYVCECEVRLRSRGGSGVWNLLGRIDSRMTDTCKIKYTSERGDDSPLCFTKHPPWHHWRIASSLRREREGEGGREERENKAYPKLGWYDEERETERPKADTFWLFWCLGNTQSIIKAQCIVELFVLFPDRAEQLNW